MVMRAICVAHGPRELRFASRLRERGEIHHDGHLRRIIPASSFCPRSCAPAHTSRAVPLIRRCLCMSIGNIIPNFY